MKSDRPQSYFLLLVRRTLRADELQIAKPSGRAPPAAKRSILWKLAQISRETSIPIVIARLEYDPGETSIADEELARRASSEGLLHVDTLAAFGSADPRTFWVHRLDRHPNARAHAIFADSIGDFILRNELVGR